LPVVNAIAGIFITLLLVVPFLAAAAERVKSTYQPTPTVRSGETV
jgi:hypothetical protein